MILSAMKASSNESSLCILRREILHFLWKEACVSQGSGLPVYRIFCRKKSFVSRDIDLLIKHG
jgi:hypothetical protein